MPEDLKVRDTVNVRKRKPTREFDRDSGQLHEHIDWTDCEVVGILDKENGVIVVDDGQQYRIAVWQGSDDQFFQF